MTAKRFTGGSYGVYDNYKENRLLWTEWEEVTGIMNNLDLKARERGKALSKLHKENEQLKEENEFAKLLANHRGEMVSFANSLIQDIDDELTQKMWHQFKEEMYQKWKKKRGIE